MCVYKTGRETERAQECMCTLKPEILDSLELQLPTVVLCSMLRSGNQICNPWKSSKHS